MTLSVPKDLRGGHKTIGATRKAATGLKPGDDGRLRIGPDEGVIHMRVTRDLLYRALLIAHAVFGEAQRRGWEISSHSGRGYGNHDGVAITVRGHSYPFEIHELRETLDFTPEDIEKWREEQKRWRSLRQIPDMPPAQHKRRQPLGRLSIQMPPSYGGGRAKWTEGPRGPLEEKLPEILEVLEERAREDDERDRLNALERTERERRVKENEERARAQRVESARAERVVREAEAWERSALVRRYVAALRERIPHLELAEGKRVGEWCDWAADWAERSDPVAYTELIRGFDDGLDDRGYAR